MGGATRGASTSLVKPPRPQNPWILFRAFMMKSLPPVGPGEPRRSQSDVSSLIADMWRNASPETKAEYERKAEELKAEHRAKYPNYKYQPKKKEDKEREKEALKLERQLQKRDNRSRRGVERQVTLPAPQVTVQPSAGPSYYTPAHLPYGFPGPSPPVSAASSPSMSSATSSPQYPMLQLSSTPATSPSPNLQVPSLPSTSSVHSPISQLPFPIIHSSSPTNGDAGSHDMWPLTEQLALPTSSDLSHENDTPWDPSTLTFDENAYAGPSTPVTFELPALTEEQLQHWSQLQDSQFNNPYSFLQADSNGLYNIQGLDHGAGSDHVDEVEIAVGNIHSSEDASSYLSASFFDAQAPSGPMLGEGYSAQEQYDFSQFFNSFPFDGSSTYSQTPLDGPSSSLEVGSDNHYPTFESIPQPSETVPVASTSSYVPPSGAAHSSSRRVAGNWAASVYAAQVNDQPQQALRAQ